MIDIIKYHIMIIMFYESSAFS